MTPEQEAEIRAVLEPSRMLPATFGLGEAVVLARFLLRALDATRAELAKQAEHVRRLSDARDRLAMLVPVGESTGVVEDNVEQYVARLRAELADFREGAAVEARAADAARAEVARARALAEGWRELAADLRGSDGGRHPSDMAQARVFERCAREVLGG